MEKKALVLGMYYSSFEKSRKVQQIGQSFRDQIRCESLECQGFNVYSIDDKHGEIDSLNSSSKHCNTNFSDHRRMFKDVYSLWGKQNSQFSFIMLDYFMSPVANILSLIISVSVE